MDVRDKTLVGPDLVIEEAIANSVPADSALSAFPKASASQKPPKKPRLKSAAKSSTSTPASSKKSKVAEVVFGKDVKAKPANLPWTFPKATLEDAIKIPRAVEEKNAGNPMKPDVIAKAVGFNSTSDWRFLDLLRSANQYGLVTGTGKISPVSLTDIGRDIVAPSSPSDRPKALFSAFRNVDDFKNVEEFYQNKKLPEDEFFENTLFREFNIPRERIRAFIDTFTSNLNFLHAFRVERPQPGADRSGFRDRTPELNTVEPDDIAGRQFLDTCFVMMPFGEWMDQYYREVFVPAIKDAGLEPVRADELFSTGSVIEQIWEQIRRAKVLLADLTGKNANVFYELGLAHADHKPVVFTTGNLDDVPFDLRHLRVAVYDIRDPSWGEKLKISLGAYLKAAKADPTKSVPQPFRREMTMPVP